MPIDQLNNPSANDKIYLDIESSKSICYVNYRAEKLIKIRRSSSKSNIFSFIKRILIKNFTDKDVYNAYLHFNFHSESISIDDVPLACLQAHKITTVDSFNLIIDPKYLYDLSEVEALTVTVSLIGEANETIESKSLDIRLLPIAQSAGEDFVPESIASFITPNDDEVQELANKAASIMEDKYHTSSFVGYQTHDPETVMHELDALYLAIQQAGIHYSNPPASFEKTFQRVRMPKDVISDKTATCLDFSLLFASLCEAVGLNPLLIILNDHAYNGVWLEDVHYPNAIFDNLSVLSNDCSDTDRRMVLIDSTNAASGSDINFQASLSKAAALLNVGKFDYCLDVKAARLDYILPLPTPHTVNGKTEVNYDDAIGTEYDVPTVAPSAGSLSLESKGSKTKFDVWEENLLDLEMSNNLINHKIGASSVQLGADDVFDFYSRAKDIDKLSLIPDNDLKADDLKRFLAFQFSIEDKKRFKGAFASKRVYAFNKKGEAEDVLISLARKASTQIEESGCNPLFLTLGMVHWYDNNLSKQTIAAPIILIPASMPKRRTGPYFSLELDFDSAQVNAAAFEYFRRAFDMDFSELDGFFEAERTVDDLKKLFNTIRDKIASKGNWMVDDATVTLSLFSFAHFVMWNDMKTHRDLFIQNKVVASMVHGKEEYDTTPKELYENNLDDIIAPDDLAVPLSADSSQLLAIKASDIGLSFVLDGPPGTGKSQTIANIIVNAMYKGKKVLFVAEKEVALDVVKNRLDSLSLGRFCLQIHSAKANKKDVLSQLGESLATGQTRPVEGFAEEARKLKEERDALNATLKQIHVKGSYFVSPYTALIKYLENESSKGHCEVSPEYAKSIDEKKYNEAISAIEDIVVLGHNVNGYYGNPFIYFGCRDYSLDLREQFEERLPSLIAALDAFSVAYASLSKKIGFGMKLSKNNASRLVYILNLIKDDPKLFFPDLIEGGTILAEAANIKSYFDGLLVYLALKEEVGKAFDYGVLELQAADLKHHLENSLNYGFFAKRKAIKNTKKALKPFAKSKLKNGDLLLILDKLILLRQMKEDLDNRAGYCSIIFPDEDRKSLAEAKLDQGKINQSLLLLDAIRGLDVSEDADYRKANKVFASIIKSPDKLYEERIADFLGAEAELRKANKGLEDLGFDIDAADDSDVYYAYALTQIKNSYQGLERLGEWCKLLSCLDRAEAVLPKSLIDNYKGGKVSLSKLRSSFDCALFYRLVSLSLSELGLTNLSSAETEQQIEKYKKTLSDFQRLTVEETARRITASFPRNDIEYAESSLAYQLRKLVKTAGRGKTLRSIIDQYSDDIFRLCPIFLMSPLSVAQYLDPNKHHFDIVIFDEASQIPTSEAIGAIARGDSCIIAGDQQQMPPTDFFTSSLSFADQPNDDVVVYSDLESLLDDAIALNLPRYRLSWHYRSHHESLIAFSNNRFYDNTLCTFPSPSNQQSQVRLIRVNGHYEKGRGVNREEAKAIVNEVIRRCKDPELSKLSIGIVTFNKKQQDLITDMLDAKFFSSTSLNRTPGGEEIFVKNLENVQGDERDVILFSVCFGPDKKTKKMNLNFGPLSREKGERRLNVAVSRAKEEMVVFCSCRPEDIRAYSAKNSGAEFLRSFLIYAETGVQSLANQSSWDIKSDDLSIASFLAGDLLRDGYQVDINVGASEFKVDIAIKDPLDPDRYALGVIVDGPSYASSSYTCDDRNVVAPGVLNNLSWRLMRVWSVEYLDHPGLVVRKIEKELSAPRSATEVKEEATKPVSLVKATPDNPYPHKKEYPSVNYAHLVNIIRDLPGAIAGVLANESPISMTLLKKRIRDIYSLKRVDNKMLYRIQTILRQLSAYGEEFDNETYWWAASLDPESYDAYRVGGDREIGDVSRQEILLAKDDIESLQGKISDDDLCHEILELLGFSVLSERSKTHIVRAINGDLTSSDEDI